jgi:hypothetical protein
MGTYRLVNHYCTLVFYSCKSLTFQPKVAKKIYDSNYLLSYAEHLKVWEPTYRVESCKGLYSDRFQQITSKNIHRKGLLVVEEENFFNFSKIKKCRT